MAAREETIEKLREEVVNYTPGDTYTYEDTSNFPKDMHIALFGMTGCGKSSLMNSLMYATQGEWDKSCWIQIAKQGKMGGHTLIRTRLKIAKSIYVIDNRGISSATKEVLLQEIKTQLAGKRNYTSTIDWTGKTRPGASEKGDCINTALFIYSAAQEISPDVYEMSKLVDEMQKLQGHYPVAVITHVDEASREKIEQLKQHLHLFGVSDIFTVANITDENVCLEKQYQKSLLKLLKRCMTDGDRNITYRLEIEEEERREREREQNEAEERRRREKKDNWCALM